MDSHPNHLTGASRGFKRASAVSQTDIGGDDPSNKPTKRFGFSAASKLGELNNNESEESDYFKNYKLDENILKTHWLFSDETTTNAESNANEATPSFTRPIATTRVPSINEHTGFKFASGRLCNNFNFDKTDQFRRLLGLDDPEPELSQKSFKSAGFHRTESTQTTKLGGVSRQTTSGVYDDAFYDMPSTGETASDMVFTGTDKLTYIEMWNQVCTFTKFYTTNMSVEVLSKLWYKHGNPFKVTFTNAERYNYLLYTHENDYVSFGGLEQISKCFKRAVADLNTKVRWEVFDDSWIREKYKVLTLSSCRKYTKKVLKYYRTKSLNDSISNVPLPNPINLIKVLIRIVKNESSGTHAVLNKIFQGESSPDVSLVLRVELYDGINVYMTDGIEVYKGVFSDSYIRGAFEANKIRVGTKILIQGVLHTEVRGEVVLALSYNSTTRAPKRPLGLQPKHSNVNIKDLLVGGGRVSRVEAVVLKNLPMVYKVWYRCPETATRKTLTLSEQEYIEITHDPESEFIGLIETVCTQFTLFVVDGIVMIKDLPPREYERLVAKSCVQITLLNVDDTASYILKPMTRFVLTNTSVQFMSNTGFFHDHHFDMNPIKLLSTTFTKLEILEEHEKIPESVINKTGLSRIIFSNLPSLSLPEDSDDFDTLNEIHVQYVWPNLFLGQLCDLNGVVLHVGEVEEVYKSCFLRFFLLTSKLHLVTLKVNYKNYVTKNDKLSINSEIKNFEKRLKSSMVTLEQEERAPPEHQVNLFMAICNVQYNGYDMQNSIYNFQGTCDQMILKKSTVLKSVQECFKNSNLVYKGKGICLSQQAVEELGDTHLETTCKIFFRTIVNNIIEVYRLIQFDSDLVGQT